MAAYVLPAGLTWVVLGAAANFMQMVPSSSTVLVSVCLIYMASFGLIEAMGLPIRAPTLRGGVPASWIRSRGWLARTLIWGAMLGPGVITVNPYASIWVIVIVLLVAGSGGFAIWIGAGIGLAHGAGRAIGIMHQSANCSDPFPVMASQIRWKQLDGIALLIAFGTLSSSLLAEAM